MALTKVSTDGVKDDAITSGKTKDKLNWKALRQARDNKLAETDWMANSDVTMSDAWKTYRKALRDLPANTSDPTNPTWPTKPE